MGIATKRMINKQPKFHFVERKRGWYWHLVAANGKKVATGGEPFARQDTAKRSVQRMLRVTHLIDDKNPPFVIHKKK